MAKERLTSALPPSLPPRGLDRVQSAEYIGVSPTKFDEMVKDGRMPPPKAIDARRLWDRYKLDLAFDALDEMIRDAKAVLEASKNDDLDGWDDV